MEETRRDSFVVAFWCFGKFFAINLSVNYIYRNIIQTTTQLRRFEKEREEERTCKTDISEKWKFHAFM